MKSTRKNRAGFVKTQKRKSRVYDEEDYNSNDGMLTSVWGPAMWHYLHTMSFNYPVNPTRQDKKNYRDFVLSLRHVLPCGKCRKNLQKNLKKLPLTYAHMESRATFSKYIYDLHEVINTMLGKKSGLSYDNVRERYEHFRARCTYSIALREEKGCTEPLYGEKSKCVIHIVPQTDTTETFQMDEKCIKRKL